jgi:hypothetical protein
LQIEEDIRKYNEVQENVIKQNKMKKKDKKILKEK